MTRRRRFELAYLLGSLLLLSASLHSPTAYAAPGDPPAGSPAGAVYRLPLEQGRADAAPKGGGGTEAEAGGGTAVSPGGSGSGQEESGSLYRSENNFGSSSRVPGATAAGTPAGPGGGGAAGSGAPSGSGSAGAAIAGSVLAAQAAGTGNTSVAAGAVLLGAIALLAAAVGILSRRFRAG